MNFILVLLIFCLYIWSFSTDKDISILDRDIKNLSVKQALDIQESRHRENKLAKYALAYEISMLNPKDSN